MLPTLKRLHAEHAAAVDWAFVYTMEAHATDEWPISSSRYEPSGAPVRIAQHKTAEERRAAAARFRDTFAVPFPVLCDTLDNAFEAEYCTWPFRFYVLHRGRVLFQAQPAGSACLETYSVADLVAVLEQLQGKYGVVSGNAWSSRAILRQSDVSE